MVDAVSFEKLRDMLLASGCAAVGVAGVEPFIETRSAIEQRKSSQMHGEMHFTFGDPERSTDVRRSFPWAESLLVAGYAYLPDAGSPEGGRANHGRVARFATWDHYEPLRSALRNAAIALSDNGHRAELVVDDNRLVDRAAAVRAGLGWWGKNTMVLSPASGPWMLLGSVVTEARLKPTEPMVRDCGTCSACLPACPTGALVEPGVLDARRCLAHLLQAKGWIPRELRKASGDRIYGCDDCLDACPPGNKLLQIGPPAPRHDLLELLELSDDELLARFEHFYVPRRRAAYLRRNVLVAIGNSGDGAARRPLLEYLGSADPMLRAHAAWALGELGLGRAEMAVAAESEANDHVRREIEAALAASA
ncbi:MAG: tRNA epoxyqueuosine(34) reductase QueG [Acidimicrobiia bacterium]|nr:tRNA epoxyqueuosine(34) reductase QueG [Acidimicrobiia bacterium]